ncbi:malate dehydrogenase, cytoplasmic [Neodiprion pinetum]|uniref:Malate dehydrogenase n=1 Tax=Neodiprion lecontei TaxID=441921 RepID=A0A6J0C161_NEOLC|nr:malate dehydrogenase, cytoplasmic [Neodiprion lecontei]XP_046474440.1 malate dehydrogenase, cytoplasmic [Neodiprion pinetum]XP_046612691.1 malate dehydrogenase, cytoplasmic [Neodiprion virginianus]
MAEPINVVVTGAAGQIAYSLLYQLAAGSVFGPEQPINLRLLDIPPMMEVLQGVVMELDDLALNLLREVTPTADPAVAFKDAAAAFLVGAMPRKQGMERKDLLSANVKIFKVQGEALDKFARKDVKVLVVGNPANTNALICSHYAPSIPKENFTAMTRLDQNRAQAALAARLSVQVDRVQNVIIWGNHSSTQYPDAHHALVHLPTGAKPVPEAVNDDAWLNGEFVEKIQKRGAAVIAARKMSSAMSAAKAAGDHMRDWWIGTRPGKWVSMGVVSDGSYGIPKDIVFSFPVTIKDHQFKIVQGLPINEFARAKLNATAKELEEERAEANSVLEQ